MIRRTTWAGSLSVDACWFRRRRQALSEPKSFELEQNVAAALERAD
jgi:hypothetical protein